MCVLDVANTWSLIRPGHESSVRSGFVDWDWPGNLLLGQCIGDEEVLMGRRFWVGCGFFFLGERGRGRGNSRASTVESFSQDDTSLRTTLFMLCIKSVEVSLQHLQTIAKVPSILETLGRHVRCSSFDNLTTSFTYWRQWRDCSTLFRHGLHGAVGMVSYVHVVYVTCYFCCMLSLGPSSGSTGSVRYRSVYELYTPNINRCIPT